MDTTRARYSGILMHVTSFRTRYGIGDLGREAYRFADKLKESGVTLWQVLPLGPTGYGNSPYAARSTFAGNELLIDLEALVSEKLLGAMARGLKKAIIPWQNEKDLVDIPADLREKLEIIPVRYYSQIYEIAFSEEARAAKPKPRTRSKNTKRKAQGSEVATSETEQADNA